MAELVNPLPRHSLAAPDNFLLCLQKFAVLIASSAYSKRLLAQTIQPMWRKAEKIILINNRKIESKLVLKRSWIIAVNNVLNVLQDNLWEL